MSPWFTPEMRRRLAMIEMAAGHGTAAREQLLDIAATCAATTSSSPRSPCTSRCCSGRTPALRRRLETLARRAQDDAIHLWARHARAVADRDPDARLAAARAFEEAGSTSTPPRPRPSPRPPSTPRARRTAPTAPAPLSARCAPPAVPASDAGAHRPPRGAGAHPPGAGRSPSWRRGASRTPPSPRPSPRPGPDGPRLYVLRVYRKLGVNNRTGLAKVLEQPTPTAEAPCPTGRPR